MFRKPDKPQLTHAVTDHLDEASSENEVCAESVRRTEHYILDVGSLLHRVLWKKGETYGATADSYADFTITHYGMATVVFDVYDGGPSIKEIRIIGVQGRWFTLLSVSPPRQSLQARRMIFSREMSTNKY